MKKVFYFFMVLTMMSCSESSNKNDEKVRHLSEQFFTFAREGNTDSLLVLYPELDQQLISISTDSIKINKVEADDKGAYEVELTNYYSHDNTEDSNVKTNISLFFEKNDSSSVGYMIKDSKGFVDKASLPSYMIASGCINDNQKYTDREYSERLAIANILVEERAKEIAAEIEKNISYEQEDYVLGLWPVAGMVKYKLTNNTDYACNGFTIYLSVDYASYNNGQWKKEKHRGDLNNTYNVYLGSHSTQSLELVFNGKNTKLVTVDLELLNWFTRFYLTRVEVSPEAVMGNIDIFFNGTEYAKYSKNLSRQ